MHVARRDATAQEASEKDKSTSITRPAGIPRISGILATRRVPALQRYTLHTPVIPFSINHPTTFHNVQTIRPRQRHLDLNTSKSLRPAWNQKQPERISPRHQRGTPKLSPPQKAPPRSIQSRTSSHALLPSSFG